MEILKISIGISFSIYVVQYEKKIFELKKILEIVGQKYQSNLVSSNFPRKHIYLCLIHKIHIRPTLHKIMKTLRQWCVTQKCREESNNNGIMDTDIMPP